MNRAREKKRRAICKPIPLWGPCFQLTAVCGSVGDSLCFLRHYAFIPGLIEEQSIRSMLYEAQNKDS
jgi:hypothetical protein